jgi:hypothetical protein
VCRLIYFPERREMARQRRSQAACDRLQIENVDVAKFVSVAASDLDHAEWFPGLGRHGHADRLVDAVALVQRRQPKYGTTLNRTR